MVPLFIGSTLTVALEKHQLQETALHGRDTLLYFLHATSEAWRWWLESRGEGTRSYKGGETQKQKCQHDLIQGIDHLVRLEDQRADCRLTSKARRSKVDWSTSCKGWHSHPTAGGHASSCSRL